MKEVLAEKGLTKQASRVRAGIRAGRRISRIDRLRSQIPRSPGGSGGGSQQGSQRMSRTERLRQQIPAPPKGSDKPTFGRQAAMYTAAGLGIGAGAPLALYGIGKGIKAIQRTGTSSDFKKITKEDPSLKNSKARKLYGVLHHTAPHVAKEPVMAAKVLKNMMEIPQITPQTFHDVLRLEKLYQDTEMPFFSQSHGMKPGDFSFG